MTLPPYGEAFLRLITPHGDLELSPNPPAHAGKSGLITPHGDLEHDTADDLAIALYGSLPLMGIWNLHAPETGEAGSPRPHYPSWGFGTSPSSVTNRCGLPLITPHGDLEPGDCGR